MPEDKLGLKEATMSAKGTEEYIAINGVPIAPPELGKDECVLLDDDTLNKLKDVTSFQIKQRVDMLEAVTQGCFEASNVYDITDSVTGEHLFAAVERSDDMTRLCCAPMHTFTVEFKNGKGEDLSSVRSLKQLRTFPSVMTMEREGCLKKPLLCCIICSPACADGFTLHSGQFEGDAGAVKLTGPAVIGYGEVPSPMGGTFTPTLNVMDRGAGNQFRPVAKIEGPTFFGGCMEMCLDSNFPISKIDQLQVGKSPQVMTGDLGIITKRAPKTFGDAIKEAFTDSDLFQLEVGPELSPQQKALVIASMLMTDYMFFERDNGMVNCRGTKIQITCCLCYCMGCVLPCTLNIETRQHLRHYKHLLGL